MSSAATSVAQRHMDIAEVKLLYPILDVVERAGVSLKRSGSNRFQGQCPFHEDRTPSFFVYVERQRFVCYGCKQWRDVLDFVRLHEHLASVGEACAWLVGTPVPPLRKPTKTLSEASQWERRWDRLTLEEQLVMNVAGALYRDALSRNRAALAYLHERAVPDWVVRACGLGYADGRSLEAHLRKHGGICVSPRNSDCCVDPNQVREDGHCGNVSPAAWWSPRSEADSPSGSSGAVRAIRAG